MKKRSLEVAMAEAGMELTAAINTIQSKYGLPACLLEGLLASSLAEVRNTSKSELSLAYQRQQQAREKELVEQFEKEHADREEVKP